MRPVHIFRATSSCATLTTPRPLFTTAIATPGCLWGGELARCGVIVNAVPELALARSRAFEANENIEGSARFGHIKVKSRFVPTAKGHTFDLMRYERGGFSSMRAGSRSDSGHFV